MDRQRRSRNVMGGQDGRSARLGFLSLLTTLRNLTFASVHTLPQLECPPQSRPGNLSRSPYIKMGGSPRGTGLRAWN